MATLENCAFHDSIKQKSEKSYSWSVLRYKILFIIMYFYLYIENIEEPAESSISQPSTSNNGATVSTASSIIQPSTSSS